MSFSGKYTMTKSEKFDEYMEAVGVGLAMRKMASGSKPVQEITQNGDEFHIKTITTFKNTEIKFKLGQEFDETTADGRKVKTTVTRDGNKLTQDQKGDKPSVLIREFNGDEMVMTLKAGNVVCTRTYKKE